MQIFDNAITNLKLLKEIEENKKLFPESMGSSEKIAEELNSYHYEKSDCFAPYMFWEGWQKSETDTTAKKIIKEIWETRLPFSIEELCGFEYWMRTFNPGQYLDVHVDEDTFLYSKTKVFKGPITGCVYYPHTNDVVGGFLEIHDKSISDDTKNALERENLDPLVVPIEMRERIACRPNRVVIFDTGHVPHNTTPPVLGKRSVMVINVWHVDSPPSALLTGEFFRE